MFRDPPGLVVLSRFPVPSVHTLLRLVFQTVVCCVLGRGLRVQGLTHFLRGGIARAQGWTSPTLCGV